LSGPTDAAEEPEIGRDRPKGRRQGGQKQRLLAVGLQLLKAEPVDQQQAHPPRRVDAERVVKAGHIQRAQQGRDHVG
jgi:hypothetical protein